jgi:hypothetical protein
MNLTPRLRRGRKKNVRLKTLKELTNDELLEVIDNRAEILRDQQILDAAAMLAARKSFWDISDRKD